MVYRREKRREFITLKQNNMTISEYELKFIQLSVYAANLVATEEEKCLKFEEGLTYNICNKLTPYDHETFPRLIAVAIRAEKLLNEKKIFSSSPGESRFEKRKEYQDSAPSSPPKGGSNRSGFTSSKRGRKGSSFYSDQDRKPAYSKQKHRCSTCGKIHFGECWKLVGGCFRCGDKGHHVRDCPGRSEASRAESKKSDKGKGKAIATG